MVDYAGVRPSLQITLLYWRYEILPCSIPIYEFALKNFLVIVSWEKSSDMEILVPLRRHERLI